MSQAETTILVNTVENVLADRVTALAIKSDELTHFFAGNEAELGNLKILEQVAIGELESFRKDFHRAVQAVHPDFNVKLSDARIERRAMENAFLDLIARSLTG